MLGCALALPAACRPPVDPSSAPGAGAGAGAGTSDAALHDGATIEDVSVADATVAMPEDAAFAPDAAPLGDPMATHLTRREDLIALLTLRTMTDKERAQVRPYMILDAILGPGAPTRMNQGNKALSLHTTSREACLAGLSGITLQTPEQREICGAPNMVPVWPKGGRNAASDAGAGDADGGAPKPAFCIDIFEFPNRVCELPFVWVSPSAASTMCKLEGKRLCMQEEWSLACRADPEGGKDTRYAYGDKLDLEICHTNRPHRQRCVSQDANTTWNTCTTDTEPSGSFPRCRSRYGVFDQHGNVAEIMVRKDTDGTKVSQLKGSAWFYTELAKEPGEPVPESTLMKESAHPDHCNFDPRWHVENIEKALHVNYHLGFRCCKSL